MNEKGFDTGLIPTFCGSVFVNLRFDRDAGAARLLPANG